MNSRKLRHIGVDMEKVNRALSRYGSLAEKKEGARKRAEKEDEIFTPFEDKDFRTRVPFPSDSVFDSIHVIKMQKGV